MNNVAIEMSGLASRPPVRVGLSVRVGHALDGDVVEALCPETAATLAWHDILDTKLDPTPEIVIFDFRELMGQDDTFRTRVITHLCRAGDEVWVIDPDSNLDLGSLSALTVDGAPRIHDVVGSVRRALPGDLELCGFESGPRGTIRLRFRIKGIQERRAESLGMTLFSSNEVGSIHVGEGFYAPELGSHGPYCWLKDRGTIWVQSSREQLVSIDLEVVPLAMQPHTLQFNGLSFSVMTPCTVSTYACLIPGFNPFTLRFDGLVLAPMELGISPDSRKVSVRLVRASLHPLC